MKVVVGKALDTRTPLIEAELRFIEFSPYWNVPSSIARHEVVPLLLRSPGVWTRDGYEFVDGSGQADTTYARDKLDAVLAGLLRLRQRPGPRNPLGDIKFVFPNQEQVYLHHTPSTRLFERERRDLSHGCIRVEQPVELASFVLQDMPAWNESRIREAMARGLLQSDGRRGDDQLLALALGHNHAGQSIAQGLAGFYYVFLNDRF